jgi:hypothetical protein
MQFWSPQVTGVGDFRTTNTEDYIHSPPHFRYCGNKIRTFLDNHGKGEVKRNAEYKGQYIP